MYKTEPAAAGTLLYISRVCDPESGILVPMQVIYSIGGCTFAGGGIGKTSYHAVAGIFRHQILKQLIVADYAPSEIDKTLITKIPSRIKGLARLVKPAWANVVNDTLHAKLSSFVMQEGDIFHGWAGMSLDCIEKFEIRPACAGRNSKFEIAILNRASSHLLEARKIMAEEYRRWKLGPPRYIEWAVRRELQEYELADYIFVPSEFARDSFLKREFAAEKIRLIPFGIEKIRNSKFEIRNLAHLNALFVGEVGFRKGILYALKAWQKADIDKGIFYVVGPILDEIRPFLREFEDDPTIKFTGFADAREYFPKADVFIFPSLEEGSALVTYEALAHGLPLITTWNSGAVIGHQKEGFVVPIQNVDAIKTAVEQLGSEPELRASMSQQAFETIQRYTWFEYGENIVREYEKIMSHNS